MRPSGLRRAPTTYENASCSILLFLTREPRPESPSYVRPIISLTRADSKLSVRQKQFGDRGWDQARRLPRRPGASAGSYRKRRRQYLRSASTTTLDAAADQVRCPAG